MNEETRNDEPVEETGDDKAANTEELVEAFRIARKEIMDEDPTEARESMISVLQDEVDKLRSRLYDAELRERELRRALADALVGAEDNTAPTPPAGDAELRALAVTVRTAQRNGHPDAVKHMDALLRALGA